MECTEISTKTSTETAKSDTLKAEKITRKNSREKPIKIAVNKTSKNAEQSLSKKRKLKTDPDTESNKKISKKQKCIFNWTNEEYLAQHEDLCISTARNIIDLFSKENTIPFIARYRGNLTGNLTPKKLRKVKSTYDYIQQLHTKAEKLVQQLSSSNSESSDLLSIIQSAQTTEELDFVASHFKKDKRTLAARAKELGLEPVALKILEGDDSVNLEDYVNPTVSGLEKINKVSTGIQHIIADIISKNAEVHSYLDKIYSSNQVLLKSKFKESLTDKDSSKYHLYGDFSQSLNTIRPHQTLAINRGESENVLTVKIVIPNFLWQPLKAFCHKKWLKSGSNKLRQFLFTSSVDDAIKRLLEPLAIRRIRAKLKEEAEDEAVNVFGVNLQQLLLTPPCNGHVMGIDPGFRNGCKVAVISHTGDFLDFDKIFLSDKTEARRKLKTLLWKHKCEIIALGNGTACRETETLLSDFIKKKVFQPLNVSYTIVNEQGVSIYSCSDVAAEEFPKVDPYIVGAISLARRLQNPLSELVKVEPKHLGVGMYQHDVQEKKLVSTLDDIVSECVSFVGVDVNSASFYLLKRVAGLNASKAEEIIKYRKEICSFKSREDLKNVKGIKTKTFQQCAGFIRIIPSTAKCTKNDSCKKEFNPLDETCIHPEAYETTYKILHHFGLELNDLGSEEFVNTVKKKKDSIQVEQLAKTWSCSAVVVNFIIDSLTMPKNYDLRGLSPGPIFRKEITNLESLIPGQILEGVVRNVVNFGAFVDVGVGNDGLIHNSKMENKSVKLNDRVRVKVASVNITSKRIELHLVSVL